MITFLRRKKLGAGSIRGMTSFMNQDGTTPRSISAILSLGQKASCVRNDRLQDTRAITAMEESTLVVRWGCTSATGVPLDKQVNPSRAISIVGDKLGCRKMLREMDPTLIPTTIINGDSDSETSWISGEQPLVLRPRTHAQGRNLFVVNGLEDLLNVVNNNSRVFSGGWYASELINKVAEYRVYVVSGRVATVARKTPDDPSAVAWNVAQGGRFDVVNWGDWPMEVCRVAVEAFKHVPDLDFSGVDVMVDENGRAYVIEMNSAPSLPLLSDGSVSYRQKCMAHCFAYMADHGKERMPLSPDATGWRKYIHPAVKNHYATQPQEENTNA